MKKLASISGAALLPFAIAACSTGEAAPEADQVTETQLDDVDVIDGTISDDMVDVDTQPSGAESAGDGENGDETASTADDNKDSDREKAKQDLKDGAEARNPIASVDSIASEGDP